MPTHRLVMDGYELVPVQDDHIERIRLWRNSQMLVLRQSAPISAEQQRDYFETQIWGEAGEDQPRNILLSILHEGVLIGYGGLVHIAWEHRRAEVSFLLDTSLTTEPADVRRHFLAYLRSIRQLAYRDLGLRRLHTETFAIRPDYLTWLEEAGFQREGVLKGHVIIDGQPVDSVCHGLALADPSDPPPVLLLSSSASKAPLVRSVMDAARRRHPDARVIAGDLDGHALTRYVADDFWAMPPTRDTAVETILEGCRARGVTIIIPTRDGELAFWARHRRAFLQAGIEVVVSSPKSVERCRDKLAFATFGLSAGLPVIPATLQPEGEGPLVVKERGGSGGRSIGLDLDREQALAHAITLEEPIFQPFIAGQEISVDAWLSVDSRCKAVVLRTRDRVVNGESQQTTTFRDPDLEARIAAVLEVLELRGPVVLQAILDTSRQLHIIEVNPRFGGASTTGIAAGLDPWGWSLAEHAGEDVMAMPLRLADEPVRLVRLPADMVIRGPGV